MFVKTREGMALKGCFGGRQSPGRAVEQEGAAGDPESSAWAAEPRGRAARQSDGQGGA